MALTTQSVVGVMLKVQNVVPVKDKTRLKAIFCHTHRPKISRKEFLFKCVYLAEYLYTNNADTFVCI